MNSANFRDSGCGAVEVYVHRIINADSHLRDGVNSQAIGFGNEDSCRRKSRERFWIAIRAFLFLAALVLAALYFRPQQTPAEVRPTYLSLLPPEKTTLPAGRGSYALSPDGRLLAMAAVSEGNSRLWLHSFDSPTPQALPGTEGAFHPFWSPDSRFIGFFAQGKLKKIEVAGGPPTTLCDAPWGRGGTWNRNGVILFTPDALRALYRVSDGGGVAKPVTVFDESRQEKSHYFPGFLPDGFSFGAGLAGGCSSLGGNDELRGV